MKVFCQSYFPDFFILQMKWKLIHLLPSVYLLTDWSVRMMILNPIFSLSRVPGFLFWHYFKLQTKIKLIYIPSLYHSYHSPLFCIMLLFHCSVSPGAGLVSILPDSCILNAKMGKRSHWPKLVRGWWCVPCSGMSQVSDWEVVARTNFNLVSMNQESWDLLS